MNKLCNFHKNATKYVDLWRKQGKDKLMDRWTERPIERRMDGQRKPCHDISSAGFQPVELIKRKPFSLTHSHTMTPFDAPGKQAF